MRQLALVLLPLAAFGAARAQDASSPDAGDAPGLLLFSHSTGWRHDSIPAGVEALSALGEREGFRVTATEDPAVFSSDGLEGIAVVVLLNTTSDATKPDGEWFVGERREAFQSFVEAGGGVVGVHGASDSHYEWDWYGAMIGGHFARHPQGTPEGELHVTDAADPSAEGLPASFARSDEWYYFDDFDPTTHLVVTLDPRSIGEADVNPNPISWRHDYEGGRVFYTAMGHTKESYRDDLFLTHLAGGLRWAAGLTEAPAAPAP